MQRHRNDEIEMTAAEPRVAQGLAEPGGEGIAQVTLLSVFEIVDQLADEAAAAIGGHGAIEVQLAVLAIGAAKGLGDGAGKGLGTFRAKWGDNPGRASLAISAQIFCALDVFPANDADRRVKQRAER